MLGGLCGSASSAARLQKALRHLQATSAHPSSTAPTDSSRLKLPRRIIDCHLHFWDSRRQEHPWPRTGSSLLESHPVALPGQVRAVCPPEVIGTVVVEAVYKPADNRWCLDMSDADDFILGLVGKLDPSSSTFHEELQSFAAHKRFVGIRLGAEELFSAENAGVGVLRALADLDLQLDFAGDCADVGRLLPLLDAVPELRVVLNHCANPRFTPGAAPAPEWAQAMRAAGHHAAVFVKVSALVSMCPDQVTSEAPTTVAPYQSHLDLLWEAFGPERLIYGSDWPVCTNFGPTAEIYRSQLALLHEWAASRGPEAIEQLFFKNALLAYKVKLR